LRCSFALCVLSFEFELLPILLKIGPIRISSLGFFMVASFFSASFLVWREAKREYLEEEKVMDIFLISLFFGLVGARIGYILLFPEKFGINIFRMLIPSWMPGFYSYSGIVFALFAIYLVCEKKKVEFRGFLDIIIEALIFGAFLYKIGQFLDGSLIGIPTESIIGLPVVGENGRFIPISLIQASLYLVIFAFLVKVRDYFLVKRKIHSALFLVGVSLGSIIESVSFFFTRDKIYIGSIPVSLTFALLAFITSTALLYKKTRSLKGDLRGVRARVSVFVKSFKSKLPKKSKERKTG
jgi:phosphatidylglycerol:prolipoprotein diacylglycerol transferase